MGFSIVIILVIGTVTYFHYVQGLFSSTISAVCAIVASVITISYHENIINLLLRGAVASYAQAMVLCGFFAAVYSILRYVADRLLGGNVRYPLLVDKIGSVLMGIIAGVFASGVLVLAAQSLPFGPTIMGFAPYAIQPSRNVIVKNDKLNFDSTTIDEVLDVNLDANKLGLDPAKASGLLIPVDSILLSLVKDLSNGAFSNHHPLDSIHPDWSTELFEQRLGIQIGANRVMMNLSAVEMASYQGVFQMPSAPQIDGEMTDIREKPLLADAKSFTADSKSTLLVVRVALNAAAADVDEKVRFSCASVRLVGWQGDEGNRQYTNYNPIGTLDEATTLYRNKIDDPLITDGGKSVDFVFLVPRAGVFQAEDPKANTAQIKPGVFVEMKRMVRLDLSDMAVTGPPPYSKDVAVLRKNLPQAKNLPKHGAAKSDVAVATEGGPLNVSDIRVSNTLFSKLNSDTTSGEDGSVNIGTAGTAVLHNKQFQRLNIKPTQDLKEIDHGDFATDQLMASDGTKMVQVVCKPAKGDAWAFAANLSAFRLLDASNSQYPVNGAVARVKVAGGADRMAAIYDGSSWVSALDASDGHPYEVWILFNVPSGTQVAQVLYQGKQIFSKTVPVP